ncbi:sulfurtransferase complex subunit TusD [Shewanella surugensis]|uniref:Sulfurtransferase complex subunit TusD n=1 Tax=Shewanella surugensis TaxID=212020 RepID=A0ABT0L9X7_9GAMM|nr:sulfurtransferase complex subunit TusD [Shewanella surugensis]MCL1124445.1 sulfurtransferase complex subunit TusD [Shewanella surugensis]
MSKFIIQVNTSAYSTSSSYRAYRCTQAVLAAGHEVIHVFFYQDGVLNSNQLNSPANDEFDLNAAWQALAQEYAIPLVNCASAALRRGVQSETEAKENGYDNWNMQPPFTMAGLGELVTGLDAADRLLSF